METSGLRAMALTHVRYTKGDILGYLLAWISLVPVFISYGGFVSHFIFRRELQGMFFALGLIVSQIISETVKSCIQQSRPETCALLEMCDSHGWPSSHSQYMFFFATYFSLLITFKNNFAANFAPFYILLTWVLAALTMFSRVYLGYKTVEQVFVGCSCGILLGAIWFELVNSVFYIYFPAIEESKFGRMFYVKDTSHIPNVLQFEYDNARAARKNMVLKAD